MGNSDSTGSTDSATGAKPVLDAGSAKRKRRKLPGAALALVATGGDRVGNRGRRVGTQKPVQVTQCVVIKNSEKKEPIVYDSEFIETTAQNREQIQLEIELKAIGAEVRRKLKRKAGRSLMAWLDNLLQG